MPVLGGDPAALLLRVRIPAGVRAAAAFEDLKAALVARADQFVERVVLTVVLFLDQAHAFEACLFGYMSRKALSFYGCGLTCLAENSCNPPGQFISYPVIHAGVDPKTLQSQKGLDGGSLLRAHEDEATGTTAVDQLDFEFRGQDLIQAPGLLNNNGPQLQLDRVLPESVIANNLDPGTFEGLLNRLKTYIPEEQESREKWMREHKEPCQLS